MTVGIESEFLLEEELRAMEFVSGDQVTFKRPCWMLPIVQHFWCYCRIHLGLWKLQSDHWYRSDRCRRKRSFTWATASLAPGDYVLQMFVADDLTDPLALETVAEQETARSLM